MTFLVLFLKKKKGTKHWLGVGWGDSEGVSLGLEFKFRNLVSFLEDLENIKGASMLFIHSDSETCKRSVSVVSKYPKTTVLVQLQF